MKRTEPDRAQLNGVSRRLLVKAGIAASLMMSTRPAGAAVRAIGERKVHLYNCHTGEWFHQVYWSHGQYLPDTLKEVNRLMRDHHTGKETAIDPALLDLLYAMEGTLKTGGPIELLSGYRTPETNRALRRKGVGASAHSMHMLGRAADIRLQGIPLSTMKMAALAAHAGGIGYYPDRQFLHVDTGPARQWSGGFG